MMGLVPSESRNVLAKSLDLPDGIVECCQRFVNAKPQKIDVVSALQIKIVYNLQTFLRIIVL
jgi:hypothetical protein